MSMQEPGLERHDREGRLESLEEDLAADVRGALPQLADLVEELLVENGYDLADPAARPGEDRELVTEYLAAREVSDRIERGDADVDPGDVGQAVADLRDAATFLVGERGEG